MNTELGCISLLLAACPGRTTPVPTYADRVMPGIFLDEEPAPRAAELRAVSLEALDFTKKSEGFVATLYEDAAGFCTIAYGHLVKRAHCDGSESDEFKAGVSEARGAELLASDMGRAEQGVSAVKGTLTDGQYGALCDFVYNVGVRNFRTSTLLRVVNAAEWESVPSQFRRWVLAGGTEVPGLKARREREIEFFFKGIGLPSGGPRTPQDESPIDVRRGESKVAR